MLPALWDGDTLTPRAVKEYFAGGRTVLVPREGYDETHVVPRCPAPAVQQAVHEAVEQGTVWLTNGPASVWKEPIPYGVLDDDAVLRPPPDPIAAQELVADALPGAWRDGTTNGIALAQALSQKRGRTLPWGLVRDGIRAGVESRWLEMAGGSVAVSCGYDEAGGLRLARPAAAPGPGPDPAPSPPAPAGTLLEGSQIQDLSELVPRLLEASAGHALRFRVGVVLTADDGGDAPHDARAALDKLLAKVAGGLRTE